MNIQTLIKELGDAAADTVNLEYDRNLMDAAVKILQDAHLAGFITDDGKVRKVLGKLPMTADECVIGMGARVFGYGCNKEGTLISSEALLDTDTEQFAERARLPDGRGFDCGISPFSVHPKDTLRVPRFYSTKKAAEAAMDSKK